MGFRETYSHEEVSKLVSQGALLVDVRDERAYREEHIKGAINVPLKKIEEMKDSIPRDRPVIVYCGSVQCTASYLAARKLSALGYDNIVRFVPGLKGWKEAGLPTERG